MKKSTMLVLAGFVFAMLALFAFAGQSFALGMDGCAKECSTCQTSCEKASAYLKTKGGEAQTSVQNALSDCAQMCKTSNGFLTRDSKLHPHVCKVCAEACNACAKACESLNDPKLKDCIEECQKCADSCTKMAS